MNIGDHLAWILRAAQETTDEFVEASALRTSYLDGVIQRLAECYVSQRSSDIFRSNGLESSRGESNRLTFGRGLSDRAEEFEELRRSNDRIGNP